MHFLVSSSRGNEFSMIHGMKCFVAKRMGLDSLSQLKTHSKCVMQEDTRMTKACVQLDDNSMKNWLALQWLLSTHSFHETMTLKLNFQRQLRRVVICLSHSFGVHSIDFESSVMMKQTKRFWELTFKSGLSLLTHQTVCSKWSHNHANTCACVHHSIALFLLTLVFNHHHGFQPFLPKSLWFVIPSPRRCLGRMQFCGLPKNFKFKTKQGMGDEKHFATFWNHFHGIDWSSLLWIFENALTKIFSAFVPHEVVLHSKSITTWQVDMHALKRELPCSSILVERVVNWKLATCCISISHNQQFNTLYQKSFLGKKKNRLFKHGSSQQTNFFNVLAEETIHPHFSNQSSWWNPSVIHKSNKCHMSMPQKCSDGLCMLWISSCEQLVLRFSALFGFLWEEITEVMGCFWNMFCKVESWCEDKRNGFLFTDKMKNNLWWKPFLKKLFFTCQQMRWSCWMCWVWVLKQSLHGWSFHCLKFQKLFLAAKFFPC